MKLLEDARAGSDASPSYPKQQQHHQRLVRQQQYQQQWQQHPPLQQQQYKLPTLKDLDLASI
jgi:hypothetical protein